jgi:hypothetical protein
LDARPDAGRGLQAAQAQLGHAVPLHGQEAAAEGADGRALHALPRGGAGGGRPLHVPNMQGDVHQRVARGGAEAHGRRAVRGVLHAVRGAGRHAPRTRAWRCPPPSLR